VWGRMDDELELFRQRFGDRYAIAHKLGEGASGVTYVARDLRRGVDVCLKFFLSSFAPSGAARDWHITSTMKHPSIADTFTVEVVDPRNTDHVVAVSRFISGVSLGDALANFENATEHQPAMRKDLLNYAMNDVCEAVGACHARGFGHGDLHAQNVIVTLRDDHLAAVLIDFDNATLGQVSSSEGERMQKDIRSLRRLTGMITHGWKWHEALDDLLATQSQIGGFRGAFWWGVRLFEAADRHPQQPLNEHFFCQALYDHNFEVDHAPAYAQAMMRSITMVSREIGVDDLLARAQASWCRNTRNQFSFRLAEGGEVQVPPHLRVLLGLAEPRG
jgi:serine/threonine protein kinase